MIWLLSWIGSFIEFVPKSDKVKVLNYEFKKKYSYLVSLDIPELDQYFNIRLPEKNINANSDFFASPINMEFD